eukprot:1157521-Pelagomonas_calceolata.AAC.18
MLCTRSALEIGADATGWAVGADWTCSGRARRSRPGCPRGRAVPGQARAPSSTFPSNEQCATARVHFNFFLIFKRHRVLKTQNSVTASDTGCPNNAQQASLGRSSVYKKCNPEQRVAPNNTGSEGTAAS